MISNVKVYGLEESIVASGYPLSLDITEAKYSIKRAEKLAACKSGSGHDCFLKGIIVQMDVTAPSYWWPQFQRYHFVDFVSSQSKMHCLKKFDMKKMCNTYVDARIIDIVEKYVEEYNLIQTEESFMSMLSNIPMGLQLSARIVTNYLQLKTIYAQRRNHKLPEWKIFCTWIKTLSHSGLITGALKEF